MNKSQRIQLNNNEPDSDSHIIIKLDQNVDTLELLSMNLSTKDIYQNFNADYGVLIGRVIANGGIGIPNAKISVFIPLDSIDANIGEIASIYPYTTPRDQNNEGKRYNLLPRVSQIEQATGEYKPKQPFGSFPIKPELVTNQTFLDVYKKYYKYTALTNSAGDYMIFGVPIGTQIVHLSVDITDIGKYSMTPASMITAGYPANLFVGGKSIKPSNDLNDLPNIETQDISVEIMPFWGDAANFTIGITRQDFRVRAVLQSNFTIFGTSMTMGEDAVYGDPAISSSDIAFYNISDSIENNMDIRVYRRAPIDFKIFTFGTNVDMSIVDAIIANNTFGYPPPPPNPYNLQTDIRELDKSEYFSYIDDNGNFLLTIPCNRNKVITDEFGNETPVPDNYPYGVFTKFYGMALAKYDDNNSIIPINKTFSGSDTYANGHPGHTARVSWFKIPQNIPIIESDSQMAGSGLFPSPNTYNDIWRLTYSTFTGGEVYSVAQFFPTKSVIGNNSTNYNNQTNTINYLDSSTWGNYRKTTAGLWFKVAGIDGVTQVKYDEQNYIGAAPSGTNTNFTYDFSPNAEFSNLGVTEKFFGGQWLNFCLAFPQFTYIDSSEHQGGSRNYGEAGVFALNPDAIDFYFRNDNKQKIFGGYINTKMMARGDAFKTDFIQISKDTLTKLSKIPLKGINIRKWNIVGDGNILNNGIIINAKGFKYLLPNTSGVPTNGWNYGDDLPLLPNSGMKGWDENYPYSIMPSDEPATAFIFKGIYNNDCIQMLVDFNII